MIVIGTVVSTNDMKVEGMFVDSSQVVTISATMPPNAPEDPFSALRIIEQMFGN